MEYLIIIATQTGGFSSNSPPAKRKAFTRAFLSAIYQTEIVGVEDNIEVEKVLHSESLPEENKSVTLFESFFGMGRRIAKHEVTQSDN